MQVRSVLAIAMGFMTLAALPALSANKATQAGATGFAVNGSGRIELVTAVPIDYLNRSVANGRRVINLRLAQPFLCADFAPSPNAGVNPVALQYIDPNGDSSGLLFGGISSYDYISNGGSPSLFKVTADAQLACCVMSPAANASCFQGTNGGSVVEGLFSNGFEGLLSALQVSSAKAGLGGAIDLAVSVTGPATVAQNGVFAYTITVANNGGTAVNDVRVRDWYPKSSGGFPAPLSTGSWVCTTSTSQSCGSGNGNIAANAISIGANASVSFAVSRSMSPSAANGSSFSVSAAAFAPPASGETTLANNQSALSAVVQETSLSINDVTQAEGNSGTSNFQFTITRSNTNSAVSVQVNTSNGSALSGSDYTALSGQTVNFSAGGASTAVVNVTVTGDGILEPNENFFVNLSNATGAAISDNQGQGTISNDDTASVSINDIAVTEGNSGTSNASFTLTLNNAVQGGFSVPVVSANGTAIAGSDFTALPGGTSVAFTGTAGETRTIAVAILGDTAVEANETFVLNLGTPSNGAVGLADSQGQGTINNDDSASLTINDVSVTEVNSGSSNAVFTVSLSGAVQGGFTVPLSSANGTAQAGSDYTALPGATALSFAGNNGETQTISVAILGDTVLETNETYFVNLGAPSNAGVVLGDGQGLGTINNDDSASIAINSVAVTEGNSGTSNATFTVSLNGSVQGGFQVPVSSLNGSATAGPSSDYLAIPGGTTLNFAGTPSESQTISVVINGDTVLEQNETFFVNLGTPSNAGINFSASQGTATINNDDSASLSINDVAITEGNSGTVNASFTVTLTGAVQGSFLVPVSSADGTATAPSDYTAIANGAELNFNGSAGETQSISVVVLGDAIAEANETFTVNLGVPSNSAIAVGDAQGQGTINNDDGPSKRK